MRVWQMQLAVFAILIGTAIASSIKYESFYDIEAQPIHRESSHQLTGDDCGYELCYYQKGNEPKINPSSIKTYTDSDNDGYELIRRKRTIISRSKLVAPPVFSSKPNAEVQTTADKVNPSAKTVEGPTSSNGAKENGSHEDEHEKQSHISPTSINQNTRPSRQSTDASQKHNVMSVTDTRQESENEYSDVSLYDGSSSLIEERKIKRDKDAQSGEKSSKHANKNTGGSPDKLHEIKHLKNTEEHVSKMIIRKGKGDDESIDEDAYFSEEITHSDEDDYSESKRAQNPHNHKDHKKAKESEEESWSTKSESHTSNGERIYESHKQDDHSRETSSGTKGSPDVQIVDGTKTEKSDSERMSHKEYRGLKVEKHFGKDGSKNIPETSEDIEKYEKDEESYSTLKIEYSSKDAAHNVHKKEKLEKTSMYEEHEHKSETSEEKTVDHENPREMKSSKGSVQYGKVEDNAHGKKVWKKYNVGSKQHEDHGEESYSPIKKKKSRKSSSEDVRVLNSDYSKKDSKMHGRDGDSKNVQDKTEYKNDRGYELDEKEKRTSEKDTDRQNFHRNHYSHIIKKSDKHLPEEKYNSKSRNSGKETNDYRSHEYSETYKEKKGSVKETLHESDEKRDRESERDSFHEDAHTHSTNKPDKHSSEDENNKKRTHIDNKRHHGHKESKSSKEEKNLETQSHDKHKKQRKQSEEGSENHVSHEERKSEFLSKGIGLRKKKFHNKDKKYENQSSKNSDKHESGAEKQSMEKVKNPSKSLSEEINIDMDISQNSESHGTLKTRHKKVSREYENNGENESTSKSKRSKKVISGHEKTGKSEKSKSENQRSHDVDEVHHHVKSNERDGHSYTIDYHSHQYSSSGSSEGLPEEHLISSEQTDQRIEKRHISENKTDEGSGINASTQKQDRREDTYGSKTVDEKTDSSGYSTRKNLSQQVETEHHEIIDKSVIVRQPVTHLWQYLQPHSGYFSVHPAYSNDQDNENYHENGKDSTSNTQYQHQIDALSVGEHSAYQHGNTGPDLHVVKRHIEKSSDSNPSLETNVLAPENNNGEANISSQAFIKNPDDTKNMLSQETFEDTNIDAASKNLLETNKQATYSHNPSDKKGSETHAHVKYQRPNPNLLFVPRDPTSHLPQNYEQNSLGDESEILESDHQQDHQGSENQGTNPRHDPKLSPNEPTSSHPKNYEHNDKSKIYETNKDNPNFNDIVNDKGKNFLESFGTLERSKEGSKDSSAPQVNRFHSTMVGNVFNQHAQGYNSTGLGPQSQSANSESSSAQLVQLTPMYKSHHSGGWYRPHPGVAHGTIDQVHQQHHAHHRPRSRYCQMVSVPAQDGTTDQIHQQHHANEQQQSGNYQMVPESTQYEITDQVPQQLNMNQQQQSGNYQMVPVPVQYEMTDQIPQQPNMHQQQQSVNYQVVPVPAQYEITDQTPQQLNMNQQQQSGNYQVVPGPAQYEMTDQAPQRPNVHQQQQSGNYQVVPAQYEMTDQAPHQPNVHQQQQSGNYQVVPAQYEMTDQAPHQQQQSGNYQVVPVSVQYQMTDQAHQQPNMHQQQQSIHYQVVPASDQYLSAHNNNKFHQRSLFPYVFKIPMYIMPTTHGHQPPSNQSPQYYSGSQAGQNGASTESFVQRPVPYFSNNINRYNNQLQYYVAA